MTTSFPDLLAEEEARVNRVTYPSEVTVSKHDAEDEEADGLLDELLNDEDDSLTNSDDNDDQTEDTNLSELLANDTPSSEKGDVHNFVSDNTSQTVSDRSSDRYEEEEALEIESEDENAQGTRQADETKELDDQSNHEDDEESYYEDDDDESVGSSESNGTQDLLEKAHDRLNMQTLFEEVGRLRQIIEQKDKEMEEMSGQLRRAVATKCDLVIAHTELERHHAFNLQQLEEASRQLLKANFGLVEEQADTDVALMNEIVRLNEKMKEMKATHIHELGDWERLHANEMRAKDIEIEELHDQIRKLTVGTTVRRKQRKPMAR